MDIIISPRDSINKLVIEGVETFTFEGETLLIVFKSGRCRNYPLRHVWYIESVVPSGKNRSKPPTEKEA